MAVKTTQVCLLQSQIDFLDRLMVKENKASRSEALRAIINQFEKDYEAPIEELAS